MPLYSEPNRYSFFVRVQGKLAGFVMIRVNRGRFEVAEYKGHRLSLVRLLSLRNGGIVDLSSAVFSRLMIR